MHLEMVLSAVEMYVHIVLWWRDIPDNRGTTLEMTGFGEVADRLLVFSYTVLRGRSPRT